MFVLPVRAVEAEQAPAFSRGFRNGGLPPPILGASRLPGSDTFPGTPSIRSGPGDAVVQRPLTAWGQFRTLPGSHPEPLSILPEPPVPQNP